jgi:hypothetical protein
MTVMTARRLSVCVCVCVGWFGSVVCLYSYIFGPACMLIYRGSSSY